MYIIYHRGFDQFVSSHKVELTTSEFPEEYEVFDTLDDAKEAVDHLERELNYDSAQFEIEEL